MNTDTLQIWRSHITQHGEKVTKARLDVLVALSKTDRPISIKELSSFVKGYDLTTLYRTLETLVSIGLTKKVSLDPSESFYEITVGRPHHHHIVCTSCGHIEPVDICIKSPSKSTLVSKGFASITDHTLEFFGLCRKCTA